MVGHRAGGDHYRDYLHTEFAQCLDLPVHVAFHHSVKDGPPAGGPPFESGDPVGESVTEDGFGLIPSVRYRRYPVAEYVDPSDRSAESEGRLHDDRPLTAGHLREPFGYPVVQGSVSQLYVELGRIEPLYVRNGAQVQESHVDVESDGVQDPADGLHILILSEIVEPSGHQVDRPGSAFARFYEGHQEVQHSEDPSELAG